MPRSSRSRLNLSDEEKKKRRREQKKLSMRRARAKLDVASLEERRRKDRERYQRKKQDGLIKTINDFTPRQQRQMRKMWREKSKLRREKEKIRRRAEEILKNTPPASPSSSFSRIVSGRAVSAQNRRKLKAKNEFLSNRVQLLEKKLAKYRMRILRLKRNKQQNFERVNVKDKIHEFLLDDENSRLTSGKKETITRRKVKKQIRLLNDSLLNLYKLFVNKTCLNISYETFRRNRPFWVIFPKATLRNTCLCSKHANNDYIAQALHQAKILAYSSATDVAKSLCCNNELNVNCLERKCVQCSGKRVNFNLITNGNDTITYARWITKNVSVIIKGQEKQVKKTLKEAVKTSQKLLVEIFKTNLPTFMQHLANIINQFRAIRFIKQNLTPAIGLLHIDFSENYAYKYATEIQSAHFGGSKGQLSLHTCVYYSTNSEPPHNTIKTTSICTVSQNLRHDPVLICAHLKPVIEQIKLLTPGLKELHILSDGPTTQYRNKSMFNMIVNYISNISNAETITWHFSETGHGKGAPDGVGGCVKRICDNAVANGKDIIDITTFVNCLKDNCRGIVVIPIDNAYVPEIQNIADTITVRPFKGTFKIHQICWTVKEPNILHARRLSCTVCANHIECPHFEIGQIIINDMQLPRRPSTSSSEALTLSPVISSHGTASASTVTASEPRYTPSPATLYERPVTPRKRLMFRDLHSEDSVSLTPPKIPKQCIFIDSDDDNENSPPNVTERHLAHLNNSVDKNSPSIITKRRRLIFDDSSDNSSPPKIATSPKISKRRIFINSDDDDDNSPPNITERHPANLNNSVDKNSPSIIAKRRRLILDDSSDNSSSPKKTKQLTIADFFSDDSDENIF